MIRVCIVDNPYKDFKETPIDKYDSFTPIKSRLLAWGQAQAHLLICEAMYHNSLDEEKCIQDFPLNDTEEYIT